MAKALLAVGAGKRFHTVREYVKMPERNKEELYMKVKTKLYRLLSAARAQRISQPITK